MKTAAIVGLATMVLLFACTPNAGPPPAKEAIVAVLKQPKAMVLDVRSTSEFKRGHVPGAINVPVKRVSKAQAVLGDDKTRPIVVHCAAGVRSARAAKALAKMGYTNVLDAKTAAAVADALGVKLQK